MKSYLRIFCLFSAITLTTYISSAYVAPAPGPSPLGTYAISNVDMKGYTISNVVYGAGSGGSISNINVTNLAPTGFSSGQVIGYNGTTFGPVNQTGGGGTNVSTNSITNNQVGDWTNNSIHFTSTSPSVTYQNTNSSSNMVISHTMPSTNASEFVEQYGWSGGLIPVWESIFTSSNWSMVDLFTTNTLFTVNNQTAKDTFEHTTSVLVDSNLTVAGVVTLTKGNVTITNSSIATSWNASTSGTSSLVYDFGGVQSFQDVTTSALDQHYASGFAGGAQPAWSLGSDGTFYVDGLLRAYGTNVSVERTMFANNVLVTNTVTASNFVGNGASLTNILGTNVAGVLPLSTLPAAVLTNGQPQNIYIGGTLLSTRSNLSDVGAGTNSLSLFTSTAGFALTNQYGGFMMGTEDSDYAEDIHIGSPSQVLPTNTIGAYMGTIFMDQRNVFYQQVYGSSFDIIGSMANNSNGPTGGTYAETVDIQPDRLDLPYLNDQLVITANSNNADLRVDADAFIFTPGIRHNFTNVAGLSNYTATRYDRVIMCDTTTNGCQVTLPALGKFGEILNTSNTNWSAWTRGNATIYGGHGLMPAYATLEYTIINTASGTNALMVCLADHAAFKGYGVTNLAVTNLNTVHLRTDGTNVLCEVVPSGVPTLVTNYGGFCYSKTSTTLTNTCGFKLTLTLSLTSANIYEYLSNNVCVGTNLAYTGIYPVLQQPGAYFTNSGTVAVLSAHAF